MSFIDGATEVPAETFAGAHPSGWRRLLPFTRSWVTTGLRRDLQSPLNIHVEQETWYHVPIERHGRPRPCERRGPTQWGG